MKTKKVTRHYCEFCSKGSFKKPTMEHHESVCFNNPKRHCAMCENAEEDTRLLIKESMRGFILEEKESSDGWRTADKAWLDNLRKLTHDCPACILSVLKQGKIEAFDIFDYKAERDAWRAEAMRNDRDLHFHPGLLP
jgi:hypothetical protein